MNHCEVGGNLMKQAEPQPMIRVVTASMQVLKMVQVAQQRSDGGALSLDGSNDYVLTPLERY